MYDKKGRSKTNSVCRRCDCYVKNPKKATKTLLDLTIEFSKVSGYNIGI